MGKEDNILRKVGTKNPFQVPDQYFEDFTQELMNKLPEKEPLYLSSEPTLWQRVKPWVYMTAMFCGIMLSVRIFVGTPKQEEIFPITQAEAELIADEDWESLMRRTFTDDYETYQFLTEAKNNQ
jgi:hypothetical protein